MLHIVGVVASDAHLDSVDALVLAIFEILCCVLRVDVVAVAVEYIALSAHTPACSIEKSSPTSSELPRRLGRGCVAGGRLL